MGQFYHRLVKLRKKLGAMKHLRLLEEDQKGKNGVYDLDISKVIISTRGTGLMEKSWENGFAGSIIWKWRCARQSM